MKISSINHNVNYNFNGLWDVTAKSSRYNLQTKSHDVTEYHTYLPFADEDPEQVENYVRNYKPSDYNPNTKYVVSPLYFALPYTEADFSHYKNIEKGVELSAKEKNMHTFFASCFLNSEFGVQKSAANKNIKYNPLADRHNISYTA